MMTGTSTVPAATSRGGESSTQHRSKGTSAASKSASHTSHSDVQHLTAMTSSPSCSPSPSCSTPNQVVIDVSTTLLIPDYDRFYNTPIKSFHPTYSALADGSLVAPPFFHDMRGANYSLVFSSVLLMLFMRNTVVSGSYIRRGKVQKKGLFYLLLASQLLGLLGAIPLITAYFDRAAKCDIVIALSSASSGVSFALLITGILGIKAYRCLDNARWVLVGLALFQISYTVFATLDMIAVRGVKRISGSCKRSEQQGYLPVLVIVQLAESFFICCCFLYAVWKSHGLPAVRGRISVQLSMIDIAESAKQERCKELCKEPHTEKTPTRRGWWDYVPKVEDRPGSPPSRTERLVRRLRCQYRDFRYRISNIFGFRSPPPPKLPLGNPEDLTVSSHRQHASLHRAISPVPSTRSRLSRLMPRMALFQEVMRDELSYTTLITVAFVVMAVLTVIGVNSKNGMSDVAWIALNWGLISMLAMHSFGRVVRRHERDALLQHPSTWDRSVRAEIMAAELMRQGRTGGPLSPASLATSRPHPRVRRTTAGLGSITYDGGINSPFDDPPPRLRPTQSSPTLSWYSDGSSRSHAPSTSDSRTPPVPFINAPSSNGPTISPSPVVGEFRYTSGRNTPMRDSSRASMVQGQPVDTFTPGDLAVQLLRQELSASGVTHNSRESAS